MLFADKLSDIIKKLEQGELLLLTTESHYVVAFSPYATSSNTQVQQLIKNHNQVELLFDEIDQIRKHVPLFHPRIETLLEYYERPIRIWLPNMIKHPFSQLNNTRIGVKITQEPMIRHMVYLLGQPIGTIAISPRKPGMEASNVVDHKYLEIVDYITKHQPKKYLAHQSIIDVEYDKEGSLIFIDQAYPTSL